VRHEGTIPEEPNKEHADEHGEDEKEEVISKIFGIFAVVNLAEHFTIVIEKKYDNTKMKLIKIKRLPTSGYEPTYTTLGWDKYFNFNNCYAYAVNDLETYREEKSVPGDMSGLSRLPHNYKSCKDLPRRVLSDNPGKIYKTVAERKCKKGYYKIMMFVAPTNIYNEPYGDFHFYKQHSVVEYKVKPGENAKTIAEFFKIPMSEVLRAGPIVVGKRLRFHANVWSHKRGWATGALLHDASGKAILDPRKANRKYSHNYSKYCSSFCVKNTGIKV